MHYIYIYILYIFNKINSIKNVALFYKYINYQLVIKYIIINLVYNCITIILINDCIRMRNSNKLHSICYIVKIIIIIIT